MKKDIKSKSITSNRGKKFLQAQKKISSLQNPTLSDAIETLKSSSFVKFDPTLEIALNLGIDPKRSEQVVRGTVVLPFGIGKIIRVAVICTDDKVLDAKNSGADIVGGVDLIEEIKSGKIAFDVCIASPGMMGLIGTVARILGPKGLMPNPKLGTVTNDIILAVKNAKSGQVEYRSEKGGIIHSSVGKLSFSTSSLIENVNFFLSAVLKSKPNGFKGNYLRAMYLSCTMCPSVKINLSTVL